MAEVENLALILVNPCVLWMTKKKKRAQKKRGHLSKSKIYHHNHRHPHYN